MRFALVDTGVLVAAADRADPDHGVASAAFQSREFSPIIPMLCVAEATYLIGRNLGPAFEWRFLAALGALDVVTPDPADWARTAELALRYADFPLGGTDASVVALAERLDIEVILTLHRRHFAAVRPRHCPAFTLLP